MQRVQTISAGYVLNRYANEADTINLGWLPITERFEFNTTKLVYNALHNPNWPEYLSLNFHKSNYNVKLRNNDDYKLPFCKDNNTFKSDAFKVFNNLSINLRKEIDKNKFISGAKAFFTNKALARLS